MVAGPFCLPGVPSTLPYPVLGLLWAWVRSGLVTVPPGTPTWGSPLLYSQLCGCSLSPALRLKLLLGSFPLSVCSMLSPGPRSMAEWCGPEVVFSGP